MSVARMVEVGAAVAQASLEAAAGTGDGDAATLRVGILEFLRLHATEATTQGDDPALLAAYREWLESAVALHSTGDEAHVPGYIRRGALLRAEMDLVTARAAGPLLSEIAPNGTRS